jgi:hypothetical protein
MLIMISTKFQAKNCMDAAVAAKADKIMGLFTPCGKNIEAFRMGPMAIFQTPERS